MKCTSKDKDLGQMLLSRVTPGVTNPLIGESARWDQGGRRGAGGGGGAAGRSPMPVINTYNPKTYLTFRKMKLGPLFWDGARSTE